MAKNTNVKGHTRGKQTTQVSTGTNHMNQVWDFSSVDKSERFAFDPNRDDFPANEIFEKIIHYSERCWNDILRESYGGSEKRKHHHLRLGKISSEGVARIRALRLDEETDDVFSMRFDGKMRIIGLRNGDRFVVKWFDPEHEFCPSSK